MCSVKGGLLSRHPVIHGLLVAATEFDRRVQDGGQSGENERRRMMDDDT